MNKKNNIKEYCQECEHRATDICKVCTYHESPSGNISQPTLWKSVADDTSKEESVKSYPRGLKPRCIHEEERIQSIIGAMIRYFDAKLLIPHEWVSEYNEIRLNLNMEQSGRKD